MENVVFLLQASATRTTADYPGSVINSGHDQPVSIANIVHVLSEHRRDLETSEMTLNALSQCRDRTGHVIDFDDT
jgi:hypothetical protein